MSFLLKYKSGLIIKPEEITNKMFEALNFKGMLVNSPAETSCEDAGRKYKIIGTMSYYLTQEYNQKYNIWLSENGISRAEAKITTAFDLMETDNIDSMIKFMTVDGWLCSGLSFPRADFSFEPDEQRINLLKKIGNNFKEITPNLDKIALAYSPDRRKNWEYMLL